jgi:hypothetical protein
MAVDAPCLPVQISNVKRSPLPALFLAVFSLVSVAADGDSPLLGTWIRPDGGYEIHVLAVEPDGAAKVTYNNPDLVKVGEARVGETDGKPTLFVKFDDPPKGYPGSAYQLTLEGEHLVGSYYQAVTKETYDIFFIRE